MRILMTIDAVGGVWRYAMDLGAELAARGHELLFAGLGPRPAPEQAAEAPGELVWGDAPLDWMAEDADALAPVGPWLAELAADCGADLIHVNLPTQAANLETALPIVAVSHSCLATWFRSVDGTDVPPVFAQHSELMRRGLAKVRTVIAPSAAHAAATAAAYVIASIEVVPNATPLEPIAPGGGTGIVAIGRWWDRGKNGALLEAAAGAIQCQVTLIGALTGPDGQMLDVARAHATGPLPRGEAMRRLAEAGIFVSPSLYEPFGLAALEAARLGRPMALADIPTYRELWEGVAAFFDPTDPAGLARLLERLADDPSERLHLAEAAQARAARYMPAAQAEAMLGAYRGNVALHAAE
jgi:glycosyltransferase involved in cell wall biosynthesis